MVRRLVVLLAVLACGCETVAPAAPALRSAQPAAPLPTLQGSYHHVRRGETMWRIARSYGLHADALAQANRMSASQALQVGQRLFVPLPAESGQFLWPARGSVARSGTDAIEIRAEAGSVVRASRSGRIAVATHRLAGWGRTVVIDHLDGYLTVYAGLDQILVNPGAAMRQGMPVGTTGTRPMHFEIRFGNGPKNTLALLPAES